jgi:hypothetical protein
MIDIEGGPPWIVILIRKGLMEWPWRSGLLGCENLESGRAQGPTPPREKSFKAQKEGIEASNHTSMVVNYRLKHYRGPMHEHPLIACNCL